MSLLNLLRETLRVAQGQQYRRPNGVIPHPHCARATGVFPQLACRGCDLPRLSMPSRAHRRTTGIHLSELLTPTMRALALEVLRNRTYRRLFSAQIVALVGTGTLAYVGIAPVISALTAHVPRKTLPSGNVLRAIVTLSLPFVTEASPGYSAPCSGWQHPLR